MIRSLITLAIVFGSCQSIAAQLPQTRLYSVFPSGVTVGQITDVRINTGADLDSVDRLLFNHPGIFATQKQESNGRGGFQPVANTFRVVVEDDVPVGVYEVRAVGLFGTSNPRQVLVDSRPMVIETEPNNSLAEAQRIEVGTLVDGQVNGAGDLDFIRFPARQGERIVIDCLAERIGSKLNPMLTIADADGRPIAFARNEYGRDAFLLFDVPADGDYVIQLQDETFAGSAEHLYRLQVHRGPHIRFVMPPAGVAGTTAHMSLFGYNLPGSARSTASGEEGELEKLDVEIPIPTDGYSAIGVPSIAAGLDLFSYQHNFDTGVTNRVTLGIADAVPVLEQEPDDDAGSAQHHSVPFEVAGQLARPGDIDRITCELTKGQLLWIEVIAQRLGSQLDAQLTIEQITVDDNGSVNTKTVLTQDDTTTNLATNVFDTATDDPAFTFNVPESGTYQLTLRNLASGNQYDASRVYRLIVRPPRPDFRLVAIPSGQQTGLVWPVSPRRGDHVSLEILAFRREGFEGAIDVLPVELPPGITTHGTVIREKETSATLVLSASKLAKSHEGSVRLVGSAVVATSEGDVTLIHPVRSGGVVWNRNGNTPAISHREADLVTVVTEEEAPYQLVGDFDRTTVHQGRQLLMPMLLERRDFQERLTLKFDGAAKKAKVDVADVVFEKDITRQVCRLFVRPDAPPGTYVLNATCEAQVPYRRNPLQAEAARVKFAIAQRNAMRVQAAATDAAKRADTHAAIFRQTVEELQQAEAAERAADDQHKQAEQAVVVAGQAVAAAGKLVTDLADEVALSQMQLDEINEAAAATPDDDELISKLAQTQQVVNEKTAALKSAEEAKEVAAKQFATAEAAARSTLQALEPAQQATAVARTGKQAAETLLAKLKSNAESVTANAKAAEAVRAAAEKVATDAANAAKPQDIAVHQPMPPLILTIRPAPVRLEVKPAKQDIKAGEAVDVKVTIKRQNDFVGPVKLSLVLPEGRTGLVADEVEVAADADTGTLKATADDSATEGSVEHLVVQARVNAGEEAIVDAPLELKVTK